ncbi:BQ2448_92 [Microbotryum intermedium]|uniref:BQ2448_92 protein n=1 Tax=Microbotryum intermedium TaxID=269621 RepID=A0A238F7B7_9BASI|nr:BQ2448_92 [Microbotryum intermedium]
MTPRASADGDEKFSPHVQTEGNIMHHLGVLGQQRVKICVVDDGVDFETPLLGGGFGTGFKTAIREAQRRECMSWKLPS